MNKLIVEKPFNGICWSNIEVLMEQWYDWLKEILARTVPKRTAHRSSLSPWVKPATSNIIKKLATARLSKKTKTSKIEKLQTLCEKMLEEDKSEYESNLSASRDTGSLFKYYRTFATTQIPTSIQFKNEFATNPLLQAKLFSKFFASIFIKSSDFIPTSNVSVLPIIEEFDISINRIVCISEGLDITKATGPDGIPPIVFKKCAKTLSKSLSQIFYKIKQTGVFPNMWKVSTVSPTFKKGCKSDVENYRQVSLLTIASKIFERCIYLDLYKHFEPILSPAQFGFRKRRSCVLQLLVTLETIYKSLEEGKQINMVYTDFEKAFDHVDHGILLRKLHEYGVRGKLLNLLKSYLANRQQRVRVNGHYSDYVNVTSGVPQGSILSSLLFLIYINDLPGNCHNSIPLLNADDAKFLHIGEPGLEFQLDLARNERWSEIHKLPLNIDKCSQMSIPLQDNRLYFSNRPIEKKSLQKDVAISDDLKWNEHIKKAATKARNVLWMVKRSSPILPTAAKLNIYKSMIIRTLIYGSNAWNPNIQCCKTLEKIQKESLKWVNGDRNYPESLKKCKILPLTLYLQLQDLLTMSKCLNGHYDYNFNDFICLRDSDRSLRSNDYLRFDNKRPNKKVCRDSFFYRTGALVNRLPKTVNFKNPEGLKRRLLGYFWWYFNNKYNEIVSNTWRI